MSDYSFGPSADEKSVAIAAALIRRGKIRGLNSRDLGKAMNLSHPVISQINTGKRPLRLSEFFELCSITATDPVKAVRWANAHGTIPDMIEVDGITYRRVDNDTAYYGNARLADLPADTLPGG